MGKRSSFTLNPATGQWEEKEAKQPSEAPEEEAYSEAAGNLVRKPYTETSVTPRERRKGYNPANEWNDHWEDSAFKDELASFKYSNGLPKFVLACRDKIREANSLKEFYDLLIDAYKCADNGHLTGWFTSIFASSDRPKIYASVGSNGSRVPDPFWGGPATVDLGRNHGEILCYSIATSRGYFGALTWDEQNVIMLTSYPDNREHKLLGEISSEFTVSRDGMWAKNYDFALVVPWSSLEDMEIGRATERMITYDWAGSEVRYELAEDYLKRPQTLEERGVEPMVWEPRKWEVRNTDNYQLPKSRYPTRYFGDFNDKEVAELVATTVGGEVDAKIWWLVCKEHDCQQRTTPFWIGVPKCPKCGSVMVHTSGLQSQYDGKPAVD